jgi:hypothetical protein
MLKSKSLSVLAGTVALGAVWALTAQPAKAGLWTASGSGGDGPLDAEANFAVSNGQLQVTITNLLSPTTIVSVGQAVSDLSFTLSNSPGTDGTNTAAGQLVNVNDPTAHKVTDVSGTPNHWLNPSPGGFAITGDKITLEAIGNNGGGADNSNQEILPTDSGGSYASINNGASSHNAYVDGPATFTLDLSGVTSSTTISNVQFCFGTSPDTSLPGVPAPAPAIAHGLPVLLAVGGLLFGAKLLERGNKHRSLGTTTPHAA